MCGITGAFDPSGRDILYTFLHMLEQLQHRGQDTAGFSISSGERILSHHGAGYIDKAFASIDRKRYRGRAGIAHTRYGTQGSNSLQNAQPFYIDGRWGEIALVHNGTIETASHRERLRGTYPFRGDSDSEIVLALINSSSEPTLKDAIRSSLAKIQGAYSILMLTNDAIYGVVDPCGIRPLSVGYHDGSILFASETCAFDKLRATSVTVPMPGELITVTSREITREQLLEPKGRSHCSMEWIYLADPLSVIHGTSIADARFSMGQELAREYIPSLDVVFGVPESGRFAAQGYASESGVEARDGLMRDRYRHHRNFMLPDTEARAKGVREKLKVINSTVRGKRVGFVDDSIVRGDTTRELVAMLREAGAREVHALITSPPIKWPCFYGIATPTKAELIATHHRDTDSLRQALGLDGLAYLSVGGLRRAIARVSSDVNIANHLCEACFTGDYPVGNHRQDVLQIEAASRKK